MIRTLFRTLWSFLPDRCQVIDCSRRGIRGAERDVGGKIVCDYCYSRRGHLYFRKLPSNDRFFVLVRDGFDCDPGYEGPFKTMAEAAQAASHHRNAQVLPLLD